MVSFLLGLSPQTFKIRRLKDRYFPGLPIVAAEGIRGLTDGELLLPQAIDQGRVQVEPLIGMNMGLQLRGPP